MVVVDVRACHSELGKRSRQQSLCMCVCVCVCVLTDTTANVGAIYVDVLVVSPEKLISWCSKNYQ